MFSAVPVPAVRWDEGSMRYMLCAFPLIGVISGALLYFWVWLCGILGFGDVLYAAGITLIPVAVTGGIHIDGFCDTADALASHAPPERKREILKDPHTGAFAVIAVCAYFVLYFAVATEVPRGYETALLLGLSHILCRTLSGLSVICFPTNKGQGLLRTFKENSAKKIAAAVLFVEYALCASTMIWFFWPHGTVMVIAAVLCMAYLRFVLSKKFGGMSGDLAGWFLQVAELLMLAALVITVKVV